VFVFFFQAASSPLHICIQLDRPVHVVNVTNHKESQNILSQMKKD
jgi:hypothetical protein